LEIFQQLDSDGNGDLTYHELCEGIKTRLNMKDIRDEDLKQLMSQLDTDGDGVVSYKEFVDQAFTISMFLSEKQLKAAFDLFDMNEDGMIGNCEL